MPDGSQLNPHQAFDTTAFGDRSLAQVLDLIEQDPNLPDCKKTEWRSAIRRLGKYLDKDPEHLPARLTALRHGVGTLHHVRLGISLKNLQNLKSNIKAILRYAGSLDEPNLRTVSLTGDWQVLLDKLDADEAPRLRRGLCQFMRYCSHNGIPPSAVSNRVVQDYIDALVQSSFVKKPTDRHRDVCQLWNDATELLPRWPDIRLDVPDFRPPRRSILEAARGPLVP